MYMINWHPLVYGILYTSIVQVQVWKILDLAQAHWQYAKEIAIIMQIALGQVHAYSAPVDYQQKSKDAVLATAIKLLDEIPTTAVIQVSVHDIEYQNMFCLQHF